MLKAVNKLENLPVNVEKPKLTPLSTNIEKTSEILRMEIVNLTAENEQLRKDVNGLQEKVNSIHFLFVHYPKIVFRYIKLTYDEITSPPPYIK